MHRPVMNFFAKRNFTVKRPIGLIMVTSYSDDKVKNDALC